MVICTLLVLLWLLYSFAMVILVIFLGYLAELPPTPLFEINSSGLCSLFVLATFGWIAFTVLAGAYIFGG